MRACYALLAIAVALISSSNALSTSISPQPQLVSSAGVGRSTENNNRLLRSREVDEERARLPSRVSEMTTASGLSRFITAADLKRARREVAKLKAQLNKIESDNNELFWVIRDSGTTPNSMYQKLNIKETVKAMSPEQLAKNENYLLWSHFSSWWKKTE
ncbi:hypothetical protein PRNP1_009227 [Phytophthora ramorum]